LVELDGREIRLGLAVDPEYRLILPTAAKQALALRAPALLDVRISATRMAALVGGLVAATALLVGAIFFGAPMAAEPLAGLTPVEAEQIIGGNVAAQLETAMRPCKGPGLDAAEIEAARLANRFAQASGAQPIRVSFVRASAPNAVALPGGRIIVTRGLLETLDGGDAFAAVMAHEVAHVAARDGLVAVYRTAGLGLALEVITGGSGIAQQVVLLTGQLTELHYTRAQEQRADDAALDMLDRLGHDPAALAQALAALRGEAPERERFQVPEWIESHPDIERRIRNARHRARADGVAALSPEAWATIRAACGAA
jgi:predicted Zn-dependent protease